MPQQKGSPVAQWQALSSLYEQACELDADTRRAWLEALHERDPTLHEGLQRMLAARDQADADGFLDALPALETRPRLPDSRDGARIGPYRLVRRLGAGGMAEVWLGERDDGAFRRRVAVKLPYVRLAPGTDGNALARRFDRERDILASLRHPNVAGLIDAGVSDAGEAWLALEYVEGEPIGRWCDERRSTLRERVRLFRQVLLAVQHAHANLVIHRDLKPANILVTAAGEVRLLDFGIAKLLEGSAADETELTRIAGAPLTPRYASPEQLTGAPLTTACDVYALGVVLYELLCGLSPYETKVDTVAAIEHAIVEGEPRAPSRRALTDEAAHSRATTANSLRRALAPELDAIVLRCLGKTPAARYSSVDALIADIDRWLNGEAVLARAPGPWTLALKFAARNKVGVGFGLAAVLALAVMAGVAVQLGFEARLESARAGAARDFMLDLFKRADDEKSRRAEFTAKDLLDAGRRDVLTRLAGQPSLQAELLHGIAAVQVDMGEYARADSTFAELARLRLGMGQPREAGLALGAQALNAVRMSEPARAEPLLQQARALVGQSVRDAEVHVALGLVEGWLQLGRNEATEARAQFDRVRTMAVAEYGSDDARSLEAMRGIVFSDRKLGDFVRARELQTALIAIARQSSKVTRRDLLAMEMTGLELLYAAGRFAEAVATSVPLVESCDRHLGPDNDVCRRAFVKGAQSLLRLRHVDEVHGQLARVDAIAEDPTAPFLQFEAAILGYRVKMARGMDLGKSRPAVVRFADGEAGSGMSAPFKASALATLAETAIRLGQLDAGSEMLDRTGTILEPTNGRPTQVTAHLKSLRAMIAAKAGAPETALRWLQDAHGELGAVIGLRHPQTAICALNIAIVQHQMGMRVQARAGWDAAAPILREALGADSPAYARILELKHWIDSGDPRVTFEFFT